MGVDWVLLDVSVANCEAARRLGMKAVRIIGDMTFTRFAADAV